MSYEHIFENLKSGTNYCHINKPNMIYMLGVEEKEVLMCRMLKALIEPNGIHGLGILPLKMFLIQIGYHKKDEELKTAYVSLEEQIDSNRRVDIVIHINNEVIPIEAKIGAGDQPAQLYDYYNYYKTEGYSIYKIYYLTPNGTDPSIESVRDLNKEYIEKISFSETIVDWLDTLLSENISENVKFIIKQFSEVLYNMSNEERQKEEIISQIKEVINGDKSSIESLFKLLKYSDSLRDEYEKDYFEKSIVESLGKEYSLQLYSEGAEIPDIKNHARFVIYKGKELYAYLCVDTNLYIAKQFKKNFIPKGWKPYPDNSHAWQWVSYIGGPIKWNLKTVDVGMFTREINWKNYLI